MPGRGVDHLPPRIEVSSGSELYLHHSSVSPLHVTDDFFLVYLLLYSNTVVVCFTSLIFVNNGLYNVNMAARRTQFGRSRCMWEDNIRINVDWIHYV